MPVNPATSTFPLTLNDAFVCPTGEPKGWLLTCRGREAAKALMACWLLLMGRVWRELRAPHQDWPREWSQVWAGCAAPASLQLEQPPGQSGFPTTLSLSLIHACVHSLVSYLSCAGDTARIQAQCASGLPLHFILCHLLCAVLPPVWALLLFPVSTGTSLAPSLSLSSQLKCHLLTREACSDHALHRTLVNL